MAWTKHVADGAVDRRLRRRLRRLRRRGARVQLERLQGRRRQGQDDHRPRQRSAVPDPPDPSKLDPKMFNGKAMTYYGRWTYKFEEGARKGAAGDLRRPRNRPRRVSVLGRPGQPAREVRPRDARQEHGPRARSKAGSRSTRRRRSSRWAGRTSTR